MGKQAGMTCITKAGRCMGWVGGCASPRKEAEREDE